MLHSHDPGHSDPKLQQDHTVVVTPDSPIDDDIGMEQIAEHINAPQEQECETMREEVASSARALLDDTESTSAHEASVTTQTVKPSPIMLAGKAVTPISPGNFPDTSLDVRNNPIPLSTIDNLRYVLKHYGILVRYDVIGKSIKVMIPGLAGCPDNADTAAWANLISLIKLNKIPPGHTADYLIAVANAHMYNPVADWILSKPWDGSDRLEALCQTLKVREDFPESLRDILVRRWLISAVAAALMPSGFGSRGVLVLQGPQSIGKTRWIRRLVPDQTLQEQVVKIDHHLDASDKDSKLTALRHWIVEIGELDSSFRKDVARLKGFITGTKDKIRAPYGRADSEYSRRTVFCATVNKSDFLVDDTGNTRWWTIPVIAIDYTHKIDMQQVFAQVRTYYENGEEWWLTKDEETQLEQHNKDHQATSVIRDMLESALDFSKKATWKAAPVLSATKILECLGIQNPSNTQAKECAAVLREHLGEPTKSNGTRGWRVKFPNTSNGLNF